ncbi:MAG: hypothetical protein C4527_08960 [Candidatus Omnitrophota bacterium]|jgi:hypothetical protein|nr:MAG: hypothetical protein C4527_08960 [Candidatus Omnitrophota bacterium]
MKTYSFAIVLIAMFTHSLPDTGMEEIHAAAGEVMPLTFAIPLENAEGIRAEIADRVYTAIQKQARYLLGTLHPWAEDETLMLLTESRSGEHWIRPNTGTVAGLMFLYRFGLYDEAIVGLPRPVLLEQKILPMLRYLITTHVTGTRPTSDGKPWGDAWQSAHWAHMIGRACWWIWNDLPADVREGIRRVVAHEADRIANSEPPHQIQNDTKAEENAWNAQILSVAVLLSPDAPNRKKWESDFQKWVISSFLRPADEQATAVVDGRPVSAQFTGANIYDDFTLENHGIVHPDYMSTFSLSLSCVLDFVMSNRKAPDALLYNVADIYENLKWFSLPDGGFVYPSGQDWGLFRNPDWFGPHMLMATYGGDPDAWSLAMKSLEALEKMQARSPDGAIYLSEEYFFASTQTDRLYSLSLAWLALRQSLSIQDQPTEKNGVRRLDAGKIILNRTEKAIHTFSWGTKIMAQCVAHRLDRIVSPHQRNGIGWIRLQNEEKPLPAQIHDISVTNDANSFQVRLTLHHGDGAIRADIEYQSNADGRWQMKEKLTALKAIAVAEIATGLIGILNHPHWIYETGERRVALDGQEHMIPACSGILVDNDSAKEILIDDAFSIHSAKPLSLRYAGATKPERARATDELFLHYDGQEKTWREGEVISEYDVCVICR